MPTDPYIAKAEEMCPKEKEYKTIPPEGSISLLREAMFALGHNEAIDLCIPIVAELLKRVDKLEFELALVNNGYDRYKKLLEAIANDYETSEHLRKVIQQALEGKR